MNKVIKTFFDSLFSPACIVNSDLQVVHANAEFLNIADITKEDFNKFRTQKRKYLTSVSRAFVKIWNWEYFVFILFPY